MLFAPALTDRVILPSARGGRYFFNRIGQKQPFVAVSFQPSETRQAGLHLLTVCMIDWKGGGVLA